MLIDKIIKKKIIINKIEIINLKIKEVMNKMFLKPFNRMKHLTNKLSLKKL
jgi:hypothetical protein